jgi:hypothetical protein
MPPPNERPRRKPTRLATLVLAAAFAGCAWSIARAAQTDQAEVKQLQGQIQSIRQLSFKRPVPIVVRRPDELRGILVAELKRDYTAEQLRADGAAGAMLGLYPRGIDLEAATVKLLESQIAGFYDPHTRQMIMVEGALKDGSSKGAAGFGAERDLIGEMLLAHELTHALQDQNFALGGKLDSMRDDGDRALALKAVAEGDATLAGFACVVGRMDNSIASLLTGSLDRLPAIFAAQAKGTPQGIGQPLIFQYVQGARFVAEAYRRGGWAAVDKLYANPPKSTQQIIDPTLYFDEPTPPAKVALAGYQPILKGWKKVDRDVYGELLLEIILRRNFGKNAPEVALARRWAGDDLAVLVRGADVTALWMVDFRDRESAARFAALYAPMLDRTLGAATAHRVQTRASAVLVVVGQGARRFGELAPAVWKASTLGRAAAMPITGLQARGGTPSRQPAPAHAGSRDGAACVESTPRAACALWR